MSLMEGAAWEKEFGWKQMKHKLVTLHGENVSLFAVVVYNPDDEKDWEVVATHKSLEKAATHLTTISGYCNLK